MTGNVVGITTRSHSQARGIAFAVPSKVIKWVRWRCRGPTVACGVLRPFLGAPEYRVAFVRANAFEQNAYLVLFEHLVRVLR